MKKKFFSFIAIALMMMAGVLISCGGDDDDNTSPQRVTNIVLNSSSLSLKPYETVQLTATVEPSNADNKAVTWTTSDAAIATVDQTGRVTAVAEGNCIITSLAIDGSGVKAECKVNVNINNSILITSIEFSEPSMYLVVNGTRTLWAYVLPNDASNIEVIWESSNTSVATVEANSAGVVTAGVTAVAEGSCTITCRTTDGSGLKAECQVTVFEVHLCPNGSHPHAIDLGLPSGTKWACCNVGATTPEGYGGYYAWGETSEKSYYEWNNYFDEYCKKYNNEGGLTELRPEDDAATVNMGAPWRMPTREQQEELINNCSCAETTHNGTYGFLVVGPNGGQLFFPAAGGDVWEYFGNDGVVYKGSMGMYWSRSINRELADGKDGTYLSDCAYWMKFNYPIWNCKSYSGHDESFHKYVRCHGVSVRAVR